MLGQISTIIASILLIMLGIFLVSKYQLWFTKHRLKIISVFMILGISIYTIGYLAKSPLDYISSGLMAIFSTGRMFVFENDISSFENYVTSIPHYNLIFGSIMTFSMLTTGMIVLSFLGYRVMCRIQLNFILLFSKRQTVYLFTKLNKKVLLLADDIKKNNKNSIIIIGIDDMNETEEDKKLEVSASERGHIVLPVYNSKEIPKLCRKFKKNRINLFAISEEENDNVSFISEFAEQIKDSKNVNNINIYSFLKNKEYEDVFSKDIFSGLDIHLIYENDLVSRQLFDKFTLISCLGTEKNLTVCVVGFTEICEDLYKNITFSGQCYDVRLKLVLMDEEIQDKTALFFQRNPEIKKCAQYDCADIKQNTTQFFEYFNQNISSINCVIIANGDLETAAEIRKICRYQEQKTKICVYEMNSEKKNLLFETQLLKEVIPFGSVKDIYTEGIIINETLDQLARGVHNYYVQMYPGTKSWEEICLFDKQSSRALAMHIQSKLYTIGLKYTRGGNAKLFEEQMKNKEILENLAKGEHLRWNAYSFANGWRTMQDIQKQEKSKNALLKLHSCLVDWDGLEAVSRKFKKDFKETDRILIRNIGNILESVGYGVERIETTEKEV